MCLAAYPPELKVGDKFRRFKMGGDYTKIHTVTRITPNKVWDDKGAWHYPSNITRAYENTPAGRKQEQLDIIAEKEAVLAETQKVIDEARAKITEIDKLPPAPGDVYRTKGGDSKYTIRFVFEDEGELYTVYSYRDSSHRSVIKASVWSDRHYTRVS